MTLTTFGKTFQAEIKLCKNVHRCNITALPPYYMHKRCSFQQRLGDYNGRERAALHVLPSRTEECTGIKTEKIGRGDRLGCGREIVRIPERSEKTGQKLHFGAR